MRTWRRTPAFTWTKIVSIRGRRRKGFKSGLLSVTILRGKLAGELYEFL